MNDDIELRKKLDKLQPSMRQICFEFLNMICQLLFIGFVPSMGIKNNKILYFLLIIMIVFSIIIVCKRKRFINLAKSYFQIWKSKGLIYSNIFIIVSIVLYAVGYLFKNVPLETMMAFLFIVSVLLNLIFCIPMDFLKKGVLNLDNFTIKINEITNLIDSRSLDTTNKSFDYLVNRNISLNNLFKFWDEKYSSKMPLSMEKRKMWVEYFKQLDNSVVCQLEFVINEKLERKMNFAKGIALATFILGLSSSWPIKFATSFINSLLNSDYTRLITIFYAVLFILLILFLIQIYISDHCDDETNKYILSIIKQVNLERK